MTEADFEYLIRTLSDARSRATELTVAVRARAGDGHRLGELGQSAVSNIEKLLSEIRVLALDQNETIPSLPAKLPSPGLPSDHWLQLFIDELTACSRAAEEISFENVERRLQQYKEAFLKDLDTARRMYRIYPDLFSAEKARKAGTS